MTNNTQQIGCISSASHAESPWVGFFSFLLRESGLLDENPAFNETLMAQTSITEQAGLDYIALGNIESLVWWKLSPLQLSLWTRIIAKSYIGWKEYNIFVEIILDWIINVILSFESVIFYASMHAKYFYFHHTSRGSAIWWPEVALAPRCPHPPPPTRCLVIGLVLCQSVSNHFWWNYWFKAFQCSNLVTVLYIGWSV